MKAIDLFAGAGGFSTGAKRAGVEVVWAGNHWPLAVQYHAENHPGALHVCQDLHQANWSLIPSHDIGLASPCCIPLDASVVMADRTYKSAGDLAVGDLVLTDKGRARPVVEIWRKLYSGTMHHLQMWGDTKEPIAMTSDHRIWIRRRHGKLQKLGSPSFVRADELRVGDYVAFPITQSDARAPVDYVSKLAPQRIQYRTTESKVSAYATTAYEVPAHTRSASTSSMPGAKVFLDGSNPDLWWLVGHYLGDGQSRSDRPDIGWSVGGTEENRNRVQSILRSLGLSSWLWGVPGNEAVFTSSTHLSALMKSFGSHAWSKHVPPEVLSFPRKHLEALLDGYLAADGNFRSDRVNPEWRATSVSLPLLQGLQRVSWQLGWSAGISRQDYARKAIIQGRGVNCRDSWGLSIKKSVHSQSRSKFEKDHIWRSVRSVVGEQVESVEVIDFEVAEDHTFCLPGVVVHNCQGHSRARGKDRPHHDVQRSTAWAVVSCAEYHRQEFFVVENVVDFMDWALYPSWLDAMRRLGYAASENIIDAADHGVPQHRERLFMVFSRSRAPIDLKLEKRPHVSVDSVIDWDYPDWTPIEKPGRSLATLARVASGRARFGRRFVTPYYGSGSGKTGRSVHRPIGTITTRARWAIVDGDRMRMLNRNETKLIMGFPEDYALPPTLKASTHMLGNAVCPQVPADILTALAARG